MHAAPLSTYIAARLARCSRSRSNSRVDASEPRSRPTASHVYVASQLAAVADLRLKHRVQRLALFGSGASGGFDTATGSDLDFLAEFEPLSPREHAGAYFGLMEDLDRLFGVPIDLVETGAIRNPYFMEAVRNTQVVLYEAA
jgi:hypothetical protein